ncbi:CHAT domain-containing protein, partial [Gloeopeniophorella convolvens]
TRHWPSSTHPPSSACASDTNRPSRFLHTLSLRRCNSLSESDIQFLAHFTPIIYRRHASVASYSPFPNAMDDDIAFYQSQLPSYNTRHPGRPYALLVLVNVLLSRYGVSNRKEDIDQIISYFAEILLLPFRTINGRCLNYVQIFFQLARALTGRFALFGQREDLGYAIKYMHHILHIPLETFGIARAHILSEFMLTLYQLPKSDPCEESESMDEFIALCREAMALKASNEHRTMVFDVMSGILNKRFSMVSDLGEFQRNYYHILQAYKPGEFPELQVSLAHIQGQRFLSTGRGEPFQEAVAASDRAAPFLLRGDPIHISMLTLLVVLKHLRFMYEGQPESLEEAISSCRTALDILPPTHPDRSSLLTILSQVLILRFKRFGQEDSLTEADQCAREALENQPNGSTGDTTSNMLISMISHLRNRQMVDFAEEPRLREELAKHFEDLASQEHADLRTLGDNRMGSLLSLAKICECRYKCTEKVEYLNEAVKFYRTALAAGASGSPLPPHEDECRTLVRIAKTLLRMYCCPQGGDRLLYVNEAITALRQALELRPPGHMARFKPLGFLAVALAIRSNAQFTFDDMEESMSLFQTALREEYAKTPSKYKVASHWAMYSHIFGHNSAPKAYRTAMTLMQDALVSEPTVQAKHHLIKKVWEGFISTPLRYASYQIRVGFTQNAVEILEQGRTLLWSEMRGLRASTDRLRSVNSGLAEQFLRVNRRLEVLATSVSNGYGDGLATIDIHQDGHTTDAFGEMLGERHALLRERERLLSRIRSLPGLRNFLEAVPFDTLKAAASSGPVILVNHCMMSSDIIIILCDSPPIVIPTAPDFFRKGQELAEQLFNARRDHALESKHYQRELTSVLQNLYKLVGEPVIRRLRMLQVPEQSRVWWCPTSSFCSLPLHAAGPLPSEDGPKRYFSDIYVCSYTPTLSALIEARQGALHSQEPPSLLVVGLPDASLPGVRGEIKVIRDLVPQSSILVGREATTGTVTEGLQKHRLVHFACHGTLARSGQPFDAAFELYKDDLLTLLDIMKHRLPAAEFAFLSACHTAEWTDKWAPDEALHLTAAMHYCGFRSVVGTLWAMADTDGRDLSAHFYKAMFSSSNNNVPFAERSAKALRDAVQKLRRKRGVTLERWVNFVHYGV